MTAARSLGRPLFIYSVQTFSLWMLRAAIGTRRRLQPFSRRAAAEATSTGTTCGTGARSVSRHQYSSLPRPRPRRTDRRPHRSRFDSRWSRKRSTSAHAVLLVALSCRAPPARRCPCESGGECIRRPIDRSSRRPPRTQRSRARPLDCRCKAACRSCREPSCQPAAPTAIGPLGWRYPFLLVGASMVENSG
jgi:hypothetical protein